MNGLQKFYIALWAAFGVSILALLLTDNLTMLALTVLGFAAFGLIFMGMMCVLPSTVSHVPVHNDVEPKAVRAETMPSRSMSWARRPDHAGTHQPHTL